MTSTRLLKTQALILKRSNSGDGDRVVTVFTPETGKIVCIAKGSRKLSSRKRSFIEPGNLVSIQLRDSRGLPYLDQVVVLEEFSETKRTLPRLKQLLQVLEIVDRLSVEGEDSESMFGEVVEILRALNRHEPTTGIKERLWSLIRLLGYADEEKPADSITHRIAEITDRPLKSYAFLTVYNNK